MTTTNVDLFFFETAASLTHLYGLHLYREIVDNHEKENALNIVTDERTYQVFAESPEDARWVGHKSTTGLCLHLELILYSVCLSMQRLV